MTRDELLKRLRDTDPDESTSNDVVQLLLNYIGDYEIKQVVTEFLEACY